MPRKGQKCSAETRENIRLSLIGRYQSDEKREKCRATKLGEKNPNWKGGRMRIGKKSKYFAILFPGHPYADSKGYVAEHRLVMEAHMGRYLTPEEVVHHTNNIKDDNRKENLMLFSNGGEHIKFHKNQEEQL